MQLNMKKFSDSLNTAVFTTKFVIRDKQTITTIFHDYEDGAWQFFSDDHFKNYEDVAMVVSLEEIIELDKTILEIADLPLGYVAVRKSLKGRWTTSIKK